MEVKPKGFRIVPIIDSAADFMRAMQVASGGRDPANPNRRLFDEDAIKWLAGSFEDVIPKIDEGWAGNYARYRKVFWTGAFLGLRVALKIYEVHLAQAMERAKEELRRQMYGGGH
jgi:hypothetical protein